MSDRELLELAAKAAGLNTPRYVVDGQQLGWAINEGISVEFGPTSQRLWNPLTDPGDALRLAVALRMRVHHDGSTATAELPTGQKYCWTEAAVVEDNNHLAAT